MTLIRPMGQYVRAYEVEATLVEADDRKDCAQAELRLFVNSAAMRMKPGGPWEPAQAYVLDGGAARPAPREGQQVGVHRPVGNACKIELPVVLAVQAEQKGDRLGGRIHLMATLVDTCERKGAVRDRLAVSLRIDESLPLGYHPREVQPGEPDAPELAESKGQGPEAKDPLAGYKGTILGSSPGAPDCAAGRFINIPGGDLPAEWDDKVGRLHRDFEMEAGFEPAGREGDCSKGEYRQFVRTVWKRDGVPQRTPGETNAATFVEDRSVSQGGLISVYGHRVLARPNPCSSVSVYSPHPVTGCRFWGWDDPWLLARLPQEHERQVREKRPAGRLDPVPTEHIEMSNEFIGQLIDTCHFSDEEVHQPSGPYSGKGVLAQKSWRVAGAKQVPEGWQPGPERAQYTKFIDAWASADDAKSDARASAPLVGRDRKT
jgi:hypothetical protein